MIKWSIRILIVALVLFLAYKIYQKYRAKIDDLESKRDSTGEINLTLPSEGRG